MSNYRRSRTQGGVFFFTVVTHNRIEIFKHTDNIRVFRQITCDVMDEIPFEEIACVILPDHIHSIWKLPDGDSDFSKRWGIIKARFTKHMRIASKSCTNKNIWQSRFWEHEIRDTADLNNHLDYLHYNPVKHTYVTKVLDWKYSSFHRFVADGYYDSDWGRDVVIIEAGGFGE